MTNAGRDQRIAELEVALEEIHRHAEAAYVAHVVNGAQPSPLLVNHIRRLARHALLRERPGLPDA